MKQIVLLLAMTAGFSELAISQDIHFSNTEYVPLVLNPALAGANSGRQASLAYRTQWGQLGSSFRTAVAAFDTRLGKQRANKVNTLALGFNVFTDRTPGKLITNTSAAVSLADHIKLSTTSRISLGLNVGYAFASFGVSSGRWASQYNGVAYDGNISSGETFGNQSYGALDAGAGMIYTFEKTSKNAFGTSKKKIQAGFAAYHVNRPNDSFIQSNESRVPIRYTFFLNADFDITGTKSSFQPGVYVQRQGAFAQYLFGTNYRYQVNSGSKYTGYERPLALSMGLFTRVRDCFIGRLMVEFDQYSIGYAHDFTISLLSTNNGRLGASEFFLRYNMGDGGGFRNKGVR